jgi:osmotically inducible lipoprotein OsmB
MKNIRKFVAGTLVAASVLSIAACSGMTERDRNTAIGAGVGAVGGAALSGGSALGTVGGAAVGGVVGHQTGSDRRVR